GERERVRRDAAAAELEADGGAPGAAVVLGRRGGGLFHPALALLAQQVHLEEPPRRLPLAPRERLVQRAEEVGQRRPVVGQRGGQLQLEPVGGDAALVP